MSLNERTTTMGESTEWLTVAPEMMQPGETIESTAVPVRPWLPWTNFAGGRLMPDVVWIGQRSL